MYQSIFNTLATLKPIFKKHKVEKAYVFGSALTNDFSSDSDIDLMITFQPGVDPLKKGELWWSLYDTLKDIFKREVDIVTESSLKNPYFIDELNKTKKLIYG